MTGWALWFYFFMLQVKSNISGFFFVVFAYFFGMSELNLYETISLAYAGKG